MVAALLGINSDTFCRTETGFECISWTSTEHRKGPAFSFDYSLIKHNFSFPGFVFICFHFHFHSHFRLSHLLGHDLSIQRLNYQYLRNLEAKLSLGLGSADRLVCRPWQAPGRLQAGSAHAPCRLCADRDKVCFVTAFLPSSRGRIPDGRSCDVTLGHARHLTSSHRFRKAFYEAP